MPIHLAVLSLHLPKNYIWQFFQFLQKKKKFSGLKIKLLDIWWLQFANIMWQDLYIHSISAENLFCQAWKLYSAEILKMF